MVTKFATVSIFLTLIKITLAVDLKWKAIPTSLEDELPRLLGEFQTRNSEMNTRADGDLIKDLNGMQCAEVKTYDVEGLLRIFISVSFVVDSKNLENTHVDNNITAVDEKFVALVVVGRIITDTTPTEEIYYYISGGLVTSYVVDGQETLNAAIEKCSSDGRDTSVVNRLLSKGVIWYDGVQSDSKMATHSIDYETVTDDIKSRLRLEPLPVSVDEMIMKDRAYGSIQLEADSPDTRRCAMYQLTEKSTTLKTGLLDKLNSLEPNSDSESSSFISEPTPEKQAKLYFCAVIEKQAGSTKVLYTSKPTCSESEAFGDAERFATENVIWDITPKGKEDFDQLVLNNQENLKFLLSKLLIKKKVLKDEQTKQLLVNTTISFPTLFESYLHEVLENTHENFDDLVRINGIPAKFHLIFRNALTNLDKLQGTLVLNYVKHSNLIPDPDFNQTLYWFEFVFDTTKYYSAACYTLINGGIDKLIISDIYQDTDCFSVQTIQHMMFTTLSPSNLIPLHWDELKAESSPQTVLDEFNRDPNTYMGKIKEEILVQKFKRDMSKELYVLNKGQFATRLMPVQGHTSIGSGLYFEAKFSNDESCYLFCVVRINEYRLEFKFPKGTTLYPTKTAVIDAMEALVM